MDNFFPTELINRFGDVIAARPHSRESMLEILNIEMAKLSERLLDTGDINFPITLHVDQEVKEYLLDEVSAHPEKGVRFLQQKLNIRIIRALANLKATAQVKNGDVVHVSLDPLSKKKVVFQKEKVPVLLLEKAAVLVE